MKKNILLSVIILLTITLNLFAQSGKFDNDKHVILAKLFMEYLNTAEYDKANAMCDSMVAAQLDAKKMNMIWNALAFQSGKYNFIKESRKFDQMNKHIAVLICDFERSVNTFNVTFDSADKIAGFVITGKEDKVSFKLPAYADSALYTEKEVKFGKKGWELPAILTIPNNISNPPVLVLVHGSGPNDKDETIGPNKPFKDLACGLASKGIAVLRYEKRTKAYGLRYLSEKLPITLDEETIDDAVYAVDTLSKWADGKFEKIFVLGHSQGGFAIPKIGIRAEKLSGLIIMAGSNLLFEDIIIDQYNHIFMLDGKIEPEEQELLDTLKKQIELVKSNRLTNETNKENLPLGIPASFWLEIRDYKPLEMIKHVSKPIMVIQGGRDYQVTPKNYYNWQTALNGRQDAEFKLYPKLNHIFLEGESISSPSEYMISSHIPDYVVIDIARWITSK